ncbi:spore germination protein [Cohnella sp.]|uniref:spore germination protein n=1 Tax=Cohnella sp. TaxID=1883426 RepID=UPI0035675A28
MSAANNQSQTDSSNPNSKNIQDNIDYIKKIMHSPNDLLTRIFTIGGSEHLCAIVCIDGLVDKDLLNGKVIQQIQLGMSIARKEVPASGEDIITELENEVLATYDIKKAFTMDDVMFAILSGDTALFIDGTDQTILLGSKKWESRSVDEPVTESLVRGPREGFTENIRTNTVLIRRHIRDPNLHFDSYKVGRRSKKDLIVCYIDGIVQPELVEEVKRRIDTIDMDDAPESGYIEQWIEDSFLSPFPQILHTERPDKVSSAILQGKIAILLDGTPFVLTMPTTFVSLLQSPEDYYERWLIGTLVRLLRYLAVFAAVFLPAMYVALVSFHQGMIPSKLAFSIAASREGVPFPAVLEALLMETTLEMLREAGIRLPKPIGQTVGIVGGLVIGEAAVQAGVVSPIMVIVVAVTAIASFTVPSYSAGIAFRILRFITIIAASIFGLYGIMLVYIMINIHIVRLKSFGIPYTTPFAPTFLHDWRDLLVRAPLHMLGKRPQFMQTEDDKRMGKRGSGS